MNGITCGAPLTALIRNTDQRSKDYKAIADRPRPSHADLPAQVRYQGFQDVRGGGAFSGKDPSKVDRSAAYATRWVAKNIVAAGLASKCEVQVAYAIGVAKPVSIMVDTFGTGKVADDKIEQAVEKVFDLTPAAIIRDLGLRKPIYRKLAAYGHMGREDLGVKWENTDRVEELKAAVAAL